MKLSVSFLAVWKAWGHSFCHIQSFGGSTSGFFKAPRALPFSSSWFSQVGFNVYTLKSEIGTFWSYTGGGPGNRNDTQGGSTAQISQTGAGPRHRNDTQGGSRAHIAQTGGVQGTEITAGGV